MLPEERYKLIPIVVLLGVVCIGVGIVWLFAAHTFAQPLLRVSFLDVGQGDAIFIQSPTGVQVLVDGGPGSAIDAQLPRVMPAFDQTLGMIVATHPDADHISGLVNVLDRYKVSYAMQSSVMGDTALWEKLQQAIEDEGAQRLTALRGQVVDIGGGAYLEVLFPDREVPGVETNLGSVVLRVVYGNTSFLLTGDSPQAIEEYLASLDREDGVLESSVLKAGHHGSKTSSSPLFLGFVGAEEVVLSYGCDNSYKHPSPETLDILARFGYSDATIRRTCTEGAVTYVSDGQSVTVR